MDRKNLYAEVVLRSDLIKLRMELQQGLTRLQEIYENTDWTADWPEGDSDQPYTQGQIDTLVIVLDELNKLLNI